MSGVEVLVVGDANPDLLLTGDTIPRFGQAEQLLEGADLLLGGSAAIVACGLARLGVPSALASVVGSDQFGTFVLNYLRERGVDTSAVTISEALPTGVSVVLSKPHDRAILTFPGTIPALDAAGVRNAVERLEPRHVHVASYFLQPILATQLPELFGWLQERGVTISLDTNWDPTERWDGLEDILPLTSVFLPNRAEALSIASAITGDRVTDLDQAGKALSALGCRVVVKAGTDGGISFEHGSLTAQAPGLVLEVVDTTGAGDSFNAGYLAALSRGIEAEQQRLSLAATAGSLSVRALGGTAAQATENELTEALP
ncbi:carbohydrate kinase family protein [Saxibacter everestensis]|uniref:Carbohydrate kinase family protein n=1 Tax=Saxibacter everestensis TaxID=2909229 RepID=A0ABY8QTA9_9MICO|nr:carbohydrate kinase family protein [Brevibacteriaceae bacterium ZFBP1038]